MTMPRRFFTLLCAAVLCLLPAGCSGYVTPAPAATITSAAPHAPLPATAAVSPAPSPTILTLPTAPPPEARPVYTLDARVDWASASLTARQRLDWTNTTGEPLDEIVLVVEPNRRERVFQMQRLTVNDADALPNARLDGARLSLPLSVPLAPQDALSITIEFSLQIPPEAGVLGRSPHQLNLCDWFPFLPPHRSAAGWLTHEPGEAGEYLVYPAADFEMTLSVLNAPEDLVVMSSAPEERSGDLRRYSLPAARTLSLSLVSGMTLQETRAGAVLIRQAVLPEHAAAGEAALQTAASALALFSEWFGAYPRAQLSIVEGEFFDGMEYDGLYFLGQEYYAAYLGTPLGYLTALTAHEVAHQWWFAGVGSDAALEPWLDEALSTYSERLFYERVFPDQAGWWWSYRIERWEPLGWVDSTIYDFSGFRPYVNAVYLRGALFLHDLRLLMGDATFLQFLRDYAESGRGRVVTSADFFSLLAGRVDAEKLKSLRAEYFQTP